MAKKLSPDTKRGHAKVWTECFTCLFPDCIKLDCRHYLKGEPRMTNDRYFPASMYQAPLLLVDAYTEELAYTAISFDLIKRLAGIDGGEVAEEVVTKLAKDVKRMEERKDETDKG